MGVQVNFTSNATAALEELADKVPAALEACGIRAVELAAEYCPVDTGLLRNSITYALDGESAKIQSYHADEARGNKQGFGTYAGQAEKEMGSRRAVIVGTNVEYAQYVETGTSRQTAQPFLSPAIKNHGNDYRTIFQSYLK